MQAEQGLFVGWLIEERLRVPYCCKVFDVSFNCLVRPSAALRYSTIFFEKPSQERLKGLSESIAGYTRVDCNSNIRAEFDHSTKCCLPVILEAFGWDKTVLTLLGHMSHEHREQIYRCTGSRNERKGSNNVKTHIGWMETFSKAVQRSLNYVAWNRQLP